MVRPASLRLGLALVAALALAAACSGSASPTPGASSAASPAASAPATSPSDNGSAASPSADTGGAASPSAEAASPAGAIPSFDLSELGAAAIPGLDSYRTSVTTDGQVQYQTVVVEKPTLSKAVTIYSSGNTVDTRVVIIGTKTWTADGPDGAFTPMPDAAAAGLKAAFDPSMILQAYSGMDWAKLAADKGTETKNGVSAHHLRIDSSSGLGALGAAIPAGASIDIWVADAGYLVAWEMTGFESGQQIAIEVTNINDPANVVTAPTP